MDGPLGWIGNHAGGTFYVVFWILFVAILTPRCRSGMTAGGVLVATSGIEFLQLWHPAWLTELRSFKAGQLLLGTTFSWGDFTFYLLGAVLGYALLRKLGDPGIPRES